MRELFETFGIHWPTILFALINTVILVVGLYFLLVKPVRKIMAARRAKTDEMFSENERLNKEIVGTRLKYEKLSDDAVEKINEMMRASQKTAEDQAAAILSDAKHKAQEMLLNAKAEIESDRLHMEQHFKSEITSLAVDIAAKVLEREVKDKDNAKVIDEAISNWKN